MAKQSLMNRRTHAHRRMVPDVVSRPSCLHPGLSSRRAPARRGPSAARPVGVCGLRRLLGRWVSEPYEEAAEEASYQVLARKKKGVRRRRAQGDGRRPQEADAGAMKGRREGGGYSGVELASCMRHARVAMR